MPCHLAIWRRGWSQISLQCSPGVPAADVPSTRRPRMVLGHRELPVSESISSSSTLVSLRPSSEGRSKTKSSLKTGLGEHFFTWVFFLHTRFFPWYMFTLTYGSRGEEWQEQMNKVRTEAEKRHDEYPSLQQLQRGILFLSQINTAIDRAEMMDVSDEDKRGCLCKHFVCVCVCVCPSLKCSLSHPDQITLVRWWCHYGHYHSIQSSLCMAGRAKWFWSHLFMVIWRKFMHRCICVCLCQQWLHLERFS